MLPPTAETISTPKLDTSCACCRVAQLAHTASASPAAMADATAAASSQGRGWASTSTPYTARAVA